MRCPGPVTPRQADWMVVTLAAVVSGPALALLGIGHRSTLAAGLVALPFGSLPLLWRRQAPGVTLVVLAVSFAGAVMFALSPANGVGLLAGAYAAAVYGERRLRMVGNAAAGAMLVFAFGATQSTGHTRELGHLTGVLLACGVAWLVGANVRINRVYLGELEARAVRLERERDDHARQARDQERYRIARELHDVVVHNVSVIAVHAGAARSTSGASDPAVGALALIERTARGTLHELRALLGVLRRSDDPPSRHPQPGLAQLGELVEQAREAGIRVELRCEGQARPLDPFIELCAYRIAQEALTNVIRHAPGARATLVVRYRPAGVQVLVTDDGHGHLHAGPGGGQGIIGMSERVSLVGGQLDVGPQPGGGFRVDARLPLPAAGVVSSVGGGDTV